MTHKQIMLSACLMSITSSAMHAQSQLYPNHFDLKEVRLLDSQYLTAMQLNNKMLLEYDTDRLLTPFVRQSGLSDTDDPGSPYYQWVEHHPSFRNWGDNSFNLEGHVGGHYLTALALAYAAATDDGTRQVMKERLDYCINVLADCQQAFANDNTGLKGFIGGQPINSAWQELSKGNTAEYRKRGGWVPFYCEHKVLAGLRDAYIYTGSKKALELFREMANWSVDVISKVSDADMEQLLGIEHGGMNETLADAYKLFGDKKYLDAAKKYSHKHMLQGMQTLNTTFLDGKHANTQVPKYIGFERIGQLDGSATDYTTAAHNFWTDVATNRTVCIGGNSVNEHFLTIKNSNRYIDYPDGPESCNSNNMLKLSELMADRTGDARYADFYEHTMLNHILSTQDPTTGGYVYFTTLRPQGYRIYSLPNEGMWCCVGTGMENHSKYGHFVYSHQGKEKVYVNLFTASELNSKQFVLKQETSFPYSPSSKITVGKAGKYTIAVRHPQWTTSAYSISVNGKKQTLSVEQGKASWAELTRKWKKGDVIEVSLPMKLTMDECPNYSDYVAFHYGPVLLGAQLTSTSASEAAAKGLKQETLKGEYGRSGRMDHSPGVMGQQLSLLSAPMLIGERSATLSRIKPKDLSKLTFSIDASRQGVSTYKWGELTLQPWANIHHGRYMCYWYQQTPQGYANSSMAQTEREAEVLSRRTIDFVSPGEQQSEAGHEYDYSLSSTKGTFNSETYRDVRSDGHVQYTLYNKEGLTDNLTLMVRNSSADRGRVMNITIDGTPVYTLNLSDEAAKQSGKSFINVEIPLPADLMKQTDGSAKKQIKVRFVAAPGSNMIPGLYDIRLLKK